MYNHARGDKQGFGNSEVGGEQNQMGSNLKKTVRLVYWIRSREYNVHHEGSGGDYIHSGSVHEPDIKYHII